MTIPAVDGNAFADLSFDCATRKMTKTKKNTPRNSAKNPIDIELSPAFLGAHGYKPR